MIIFPITNHLHWMLLLFLDYINDAPVLNSAAQVCSAEYGTLGWAKQQCDNDINCKWLHDYGCDDVNWRFCSNINHDDYLYQGTNIQGCSKVKIGNQAQNKGNILYFRLTTYELTPKR